MTQVKWEKQQIEDILMLSPMQEGILYHYLENPGSEQYFEQVCLRLTGQLLLPALEEAWNVVLQSNEMLRVVFHWKKVERPVQIVLKEQRLSLAVSDLCELAPAEQELQLQTLLAAERRKGFDFAQGPLLRVQVCQLAEEHVALIWSYHHILCDGWSSGIILQEVFQAYASLICGETPVVTPKKKYKEYLRWLKQRDQMREQNFWREFLAGLEVQTLLPQDVYQQWEEAEVGSLEQILPTLLAAQVDHLAKVLGVTVPIVLSGAWGILLEKYNQAGDTVFGVTVSGRPGDLSGVEGMVGLFINTIPVRVHNASELTVAELLCQLQADAIRCKEFEQTPLVEIQEQSSFGGGNRLFDSILVMETYPLDQVLQGLEQSKLQIEGYHAHEMTNFPLTIIVTLRDEIRFQWIFQTESFSTRMMERLGHLYQHTLEEMVKAPHRGISKFDLLTGIERQQLLVEFNQTDAAFPREQVILQLFAEQAAKQPEAEALVYGDQVITYRELELATCRLAALLQQKGVGSERVVGLLMEPSLEMVVAIFGVLQAGGAYLPMDPHNPLERIRFMLADSEVKILLTQHKFADQVRELKEVEVIEFDRVSEDLERFSDLQTLVQTTTPSTLAYIIYTSGSTGQPKGVQVEHQSLVNLLTSMQKDYPVGVGDTWLLKTPYTFDVSLTELFGWILGGGRLAILEPGGEKEPRKILETIEQYQVTHLNFVPSMYSGFMDYLEAVVMEGAKSTVQDSLLMNVVVDRKTDSVRIKALHSLKYLMVAGETITREQARRFYHFSDSTEFVNLYGPTEATVYVSQFPLREMEMYHSVPIGKGLANTQFYILDRYDQFQPIGFSGELCIGGDCLARGYLHRPELTNNKFVEHPTVGRIYRSGDLARWLADGNIEYLGRVDAQVKIRGYRIEIGEIENQLLTHSLIREAAVVAREDTNGLKYLCAYLVTDQRLEKTVLQGYLAQFLPEYMIPAHYIYLPELPLTPNGKLDRKALPAPEIEVAQYVPPRTVLEEQLAKIWQELLRVKQVGISDTFFALGGHSIKAVQMAARIYKETGVEITVRDLFTASTVEGVAALVEERKQVVEKNRLPEIVKQPDQTYYPVSSAQKRLYLLHQLDPKSLAYNMPMAFELTGHFDLVRFEQIMAELVRRHEALRTSFAVVEGELVQRVWAKADFAVIHSIEEGSLNREAHFARFVQPFDLSIAPLCRVEVVKFAEDHHLLLIDMHHSVSDGASLELFQTEFTQAYSGHTLTQVELQYRDFAVWQNQFLQSEKVQQQAEYWQKEFSGELPVLNLPTDRQRPAVWTGTADTVEVTLPQETSAHLYEVANARGVTPFAVLFSCFSIVLAKYSGVDELVVGTPVNGRPYPELQKIMGMFVNTIALKSQPFGKKRFGEYLAEVQNTILLGLENQDYQFDQLIEELHLERDLSRNPLFETMFVLQEVSKQEEYLQMPGLAFQYLRFENAVTKFDLTLLADASPAGFTFRFEYAATLFDRVTIERMAEHFLHLVQNVVQDPEVRLQDVEMISQQEKELLLYGFNDTEVCYPRDKTVHQLFTEQAARRGEQVAVRFADQVLTYRELALRSRWIADHLRRHEVGLDQVIGLLADPSLELICGILGILQAGAAYLPVDPELPVERKRFMLQDAGVQIILAQSQYQSLTTDGLFSGEVLDLQELSRTATDLTEIEDVGNLPNSTPENLAYVMYTSGSTGQPKGVMIPHRGIVRLVYETSYRQLTEDERFINVSPFTFDASTFNLWGALLHGGELILVSKDGVLSQQRLAELLVKEKVTTGVWTTSLFNQMVDEMPEGFRQMKYVYVGGEALSVSHMRKARQLFPETQFINGYGPTENTTFTTYHPIREVPEGRSIPLGRPLSNTRLYILDRYQKLAPLGAVGELYIGGDGLARGYLNRPELTEELFIENPYHYGELLYKSGDLVRYLPDGTLEFWGRKDQQVKIRGFRIELGEIEAGLKQQPEIQNAYLQVRTDGSGQKYLAAYLVCVGQLQREELRRNLLQTLPAYMVPNVFVQLPDLPLNPNGKVDWRSLPEPDEYRQGNNYIAPRTLVEAKVAEIFADVLHCGPVGVTDNFFLLGGHSLKATQVIARIAKELKVELPFRELFQTPVVEDLARCITRCEETTNRVILKQPDQEYYPVSSAQRRMYLLQELSGTDGIAYNIPLCLLLEGELQRVRFEEAFHIVIMRHESLRTVFPVVQGEPVQQILREMPFEITYSMLADQSIEPKGVEDPGVMSDPCVLREVSAKFRAFVRPFRLEKAPLLRAELVQVEPEKHFLFLDLHHIIADGVSLSNLVREVAAIYMGETLPDLLLQYRDFAVWQNELFKSEELQQQEVYWLTEFAGELPILDLPTDEPRPAIQSFAGSSYDFTLSEAMLTALKKLAQSEGVTLNILLLAIYNVLLSRYSGQEDIIVGMPVAGRWHGDLEAMIGMFVNTLAIRSQPAVEKRFREYLQEVREKVLKAQENQDYQFEMLIERLELERDLSRNPLIDTVFGMQNMLDSANFQLGKLHFRQWEMPGEIAKFDLSLTASETGELLQFRFDYCTKLFHLAMIAQMADHFCHLVEEVVQNPEVLLLELEMLSSGEKTRLLYTWNETCVPYPTEFTLAERFEQQVRKKPEKVAVRLEEQSLCYRELNALANRVAWALRERGVVSEQIVGLMVERSLTMVVGILGILKAGGAYLPIDPELPVARKQFMVTDADVHIVLTQGHLLPQSGLKADHLAILDLDDAKMFASYPTDNPPIVNTPRNLAYVIYTSGSTGQPKGVMIEQYGVNRLFHGIDYMEVSERASVLQLSNYNFDASVIDFCSTLLYGGELVLIRKDDLLSLQTLANRLISEQITFCLISPVLFNQLIDEAPEGLKGLRHVMIGGDVVSVPHIRKALQLLPDTVLVNGYGPTETTVLAISHRIDRLAENCWTVPIGRPVANVRVYLLDKYQRPVPPGVLGEIYIGGEGLARGYLNREDLTREKFIPNPWIPGEQIYKSGDSGRFLPDGTIQFMGRIDHQVKIRGLRIELGEIETALAEYPGVKEAVVLVRGEAESRYLVGYFTADQTIEPDALRQELLRSLPDYMVPAHFLQLPQFPVSSTGKIDRKSLPEVGESQTHNTYVAPRTEEERRVAAIFADVLGLERVGVLDHFFALGGHSLKAAQVVARIAAEFGVELPLRAVFQSPVVSELAQLITQQGGTSSVVIEQQPGRDYYPVSSAQKRLYILAQLDAKNTVYNMPLAMELTGKLDQARFSIAFQQLVQRHEALRTVFELVDGEPVQRVLPNALLAISFYEIPSDEVKGRVQEFIHPFDLQAAPLMRVELLKLCEESHLMLVDLHHIIADGLSMDLLLQEFAQFYEGIEPPSLRLQYRDFAVWQNKLLASARVQELEEYWLSVFTGELPVLQLPTDLPRPVVQNYTGASLDFTVDATTLQALKTLAQTTGTTLYMVLLAIYSLLLSRYSGQEDLIVGTPVSGRQHQDLYSVIGMFVNTMAIRMEPQGEMTVSDFLNRVKESVLAAMEHQDYPFELLIDQLQVERSINRNPLFDTVFTLQNIHTDERQIALTELSLCEYPLDYEGAKFDLTLSAREMDHELQCNFNYAISLFLPKTVEQMARHYVNLLKDVTGKWDQQLKDLEMLDLAEKRLLLQRGEGISLPFPHEQTLDALITTWAKKTPDAPAVSCGKRVLSYARLMEQVNGLAFQLQKRGVEPDEVIGIVAERSIEMVVGMLAIIRAGAAYLPLNPEYPSERIEFMLNDSSARFLLIQPHLRQRVQFPGEVLLLEDSSGAEGVDTEWLEVPRNHTARNLAYVIYTSGSTGVPKGVMVEHRALTNFLFAMYHNYAEQIGPGDRCLSMVNISFDVANFELWLPLTFGATLVLYESPLTFDVEEIAQTLIESAITMAYIPPTLLKELHQRLMEGSQVSSDRVSTWNQHEQGEREAEQMNGGQRAWNQIEPGQSTQLKLNKLLVGVEPIKDYILEDYLQLDPALLIVNGYGPTEATVCATAYRYTTQQPTGKNVPIGRPLANLQVVLLDQNQNLVPPGVAGELCISGVGLARGYLNKLEFTAQKFVNHPFRPGELMYRTGDLARWLPDGNIEFVGRVDHQVKIRGYRIEPGEIETQFLKIQGIEEVVVVTGEHGDGIKYLAAYFIADRVFTAGDLRKHLLQQLPDYMIPAYFIQLDEFPLTLSGKVNRRALPEPMGRVQTGKEYIAPRNEVEERIAQIWQQILGVSQVSVNETFFELGGNSLLLIKTFEAVKQTFPSLELAIADLFTYNTVAQLAEVIQAQFTPDGSEEDENEIEEFFL